MRRYSSAMRHWVSGVLAIFGVTAAVTVPLLTGSETAQGNGWLLYGHSPTTGRLVSICYDHNCYTKAEALRLCKRGKDLKLVCDAWSLAAKHRDRTFPGVLPPHTTP